MRMPTIEVPRRTTMETRLKSQQRSTTGIVETRSHQNRRTTVDIQPLTRPTLGLGGSKSSTTSDGSKSTLVGRGGGVSSTCSTRASPLSDLGSSSCGPNGAKLIVSIDTNEDEDLQVRSSISEGVEGAEDKENENKNSSRKDIGTSGSTTTGGAGGGGHQDQQGPQARRVVEQVVQYKKNSPALSVDHADSGRTEVEQHSGRALTSTNIKKPFSSCSAMILGQKTKPFEAKTSTLTTLSTCSASKTTTTTSTTSAVTAGAAAGAGAGADAAQFLIPAPGCLQHPFNTRPTMLTLPNQIVQKTPATSNGARSSDGAPYFRVRLRAGHLMLPPGCIALPAFKIIPEEQQQDKKVEVAVNLKKRKEDVGIVGDEQEVDVDIGTNKNQLDTVELPKMNRTEIMKEGQHHEVASSSCASDMNKDTARLHASSSSTTYPRICKTKNHTSGLATASAVAATSIRTTTPGPPVLSSWRTNIPDEQKSWKSTIPMTSISSSMHPQTAGPHRVRAHSGESDEEGASFRLNEIYDSISKFLLR
ncbi:unnamed protein product [Amoebophrya sp. A25]|nr:unnamed protein product [Amoebophrya sp. A25]|eukprot:GSA25T00018586001.1